MNGHPPYLIALLAILVALLGLCIAKLLAERRRAVRRKGSWRRKLRR